MMREGDRHPHYNGGMDANEFRMVSCVASLPDGAADDETLTAYRVLREQLGASDASVRRAKHVAGGIRVDGEFVWVNAPVRVGQKVSLVIDGPGLAGSETRLEPEEGELAVVHADDDLVVVDKPAGLVMYPSPGHARGTLANRVSGWMRAQGISRGLHAVHRLDQGTSGLVVFAFNSYAKDRLQGQLHTGAFMREYLAVCEGVPDPCEGLVDAPVGRLTRHPNTYGVSPDGKPALTRYRVVKVVAASGNGPTTRTLSLVRLRLETGRTHQIRIHMAHIGCPLVGDAAYGSPSPLIGRPALHSHSITLEHPVNSEKMTCVSPLPIDLQALVGAKYAPW